MVKRSEFIVGGELGKKIAENINIKIVDAGGTETNASTLVACFTPKDFPGLFQTVLNGHLSDTDLLMMLSEIQGAVLQAIVLGGQFTKDQAVEALAKTAAFSVYLAFDHDEAEEA